MNFMLFCLVLILLNYQHLLKVSIEDNITVTLIAVLSSSGMIFDHMCLFMNCGWLL